MPLFFLSARMQCLDILENLRYFGRFHSRDLRDTRHRSAIVLNFSDVATPYHHIIDKTTL